MGIFDEERNWTTRFRYTGDNPKAGVVFRPLALKVLERLKGNLDLGLNLGMSFTKHIVLDDNTIMHIRIDPGVTNEMADINIVSDMPSHKRPTQIGEEFDTNFCPPLPVSDEGEVFSELLGMNFNEMDTDGDEDLITIGTDDFDTPDGNFEENLDWYKHDLERPIRFMGQEREFFYINAAQWTFSGLPFHANFSPAPMIDFIAGNDCAGGGIDFCGQNVINGNGVWDNFGEGILFNWGHSMAIHHPPSRTPEGVTGLIDNLNGGTRLLRIYDGPFIQTTATGQANVRRCVILQLNNFEVVYVYSGQIGFGDARASGCPAAIGWFFRDPSFPVVFPGDVLDVDTGSVFGGSWLLPAGCASECEGGDSTPIFTACGLTDEAFIALAFVNLTFKHELNKKSFWVYLDGDGFPTGEITQSFDGDSLISFQ